MFWRIAGCQQQRGHGRKVYFVWLRIANTHLISDMNSPYKEGKEQDHQTGNTRAIADIVQE